MHPWVTSDGAHPLPSEEDCCLVQVNDEDIHTVVKSIPKLDTLILIKTMLKKHSFQNPFTKPVAGRSPQPSQRARLERFTKAGRSNSAPGSYHMIERYREKLLLFLYFFDLLHRTNFLFLLFL